MAPSSTRFIVSRTPKSYRQHRPDTTLSPFAAASAHVASTLRTPGPSTATGFSQKTCLPASTQALSWIGRKCGGGGQEHHVDAAIDELLVGVETDETVFGIDGDAVVGTAV